MKLNQYYLRPLPLLISLIGSISKCVSFQTMELKKKHHSDHLICISCAWKFNGVVIFLGSLVKIILAQLKLTIPFGGSVAQLDKSDKARPAWWANNVPPRLPSKCQHCWVSGCPQYSHQFCNIKKIINI
jgi:hypothetical protein